jgi:putative SOS response-associated peptidase YedK
MCGRFSNTLKSNNLSKLGIEIPEDYSNSINIAPSEMVWVFTKKFKLHQVKWGIPGFEEKLMINTRSESFSQKPIFFNAMRHGHRCIIPCDSYYEFMDIDDRKSVMRIHREDDGFLLMAGVFSLDSKRNRWGFSIFTKDAHKSVSHIHHRMPVLIEPYQIDDWLIGPDAEALFANSVEIRLNAYEVDPKLRNPNWRGIEAHDPYEPPETFGWLS